MHFKVKTFKVLNPDNSVSLPYLASNVIPRGIFSYYPFSCIHFENLACQKISTSNRPVPTGHSAPVKPLQTLYIILWNGLLFYCCRCIYTLARI